MALISTHRADRAHVWPIERMLRVFGYRLFTGDEKADVAIAIGDRVEMLQAAITYVEEGVPLVHVHGGEHTYGSLDERWRYALSEIADQHCVATDDAARELLKAVRVREEAIHITGAPGLDDILPRKPVMFPHEAIIHYNPVIDAEQSKLEFAAIVEGLGIHTPQRLFSLEQTLWIKMNGDRGSFGVGEELEPAAYRDELATAKVIIGNTSAGIIEAPSVGTWFVNVGDRQKGRVRAGNVIDVPPEPERIREAVRDAISRPRYSGPNPYYIDGHASERIRDVLLAMA